MHKNDMKGTVRMSCCELLIIIMLDKDNLHLCFFPHKNTNIHAYTHAHTCIHTCTKNQLEFNPAPTYLKMSPTQCNLLLISCYMYKSCLKILHKTKTCYKCG